MLKKLKKNEFILLLINEWKFNAFIEKKVNFDRVSSTRRAISAIDPLFYGEIKLKKIKYYKHKQATASNTNDNPTN